MKAKVDCLKELSDESMDEEDSENNDCWIRSSNINAVDIEYFNKFVDKLSGIEVLMRLIIAQSWLL
jgi:hypothetical protein